MVLSKNIKRLLSIVLCLAMCVSLLPAAAFAAEDEPLDPPAEVEVTETPAEPEVTETPDEPEPTETPDEPEPTEFPDEPEPTETPEVPEPSETPDGPEPTETPADPEPSKTPDEPEGTVITIELQPKDAEPAKGAAEFAVLASVNTDEALAYQWQRLDESVDYADAGAREAAWQDIAGETAAVLRLSGLEDEEALAGAMKYAYRCVIAAGEARAVTAEARLAVSERMEPCSAKADIASGSCGANLTWTLNGSGTLTITGTGAMTEYNSNSVPWYSYRTQITRVVVSSGATTICSRAFADCSNLASVSLPGTLETIKPNAFTNCTSLSGIVIPNSVTTLGANAFKGDSRLGSVTLSSGLTLIADSTFSGCSSLTSVSIPSGVTKIVSYAFSSCAGLRSVSFPSTLTEIGTYAFTGCSSLTSITLPENVATISTYAFNNCTGLTGVTIKCPDVAVANASFQNCSAITTVTSPSWRAFQNCSPTRLIIPNTVTTLQKNAFVNCSSFTSVTFPSTVTAIGQSSFENCSGLTSISLPDGVTTIGSYAFKNCTGLVSIMIPDTVTSIGSYAFQQAPLADVYYDGSEGEWHGISISGTGNSTLTSANIHFSRSGSCGAGLTWVLTKEGVLTISGSGSMPDYGSTSSPWYPKRAMVTSVVLSSGLIAVGGNAFSGCSSLSSVTIPDGVSAIGSAAFSGCHSLSSVTIPGSVSTIGSAFAGCAGLTSVTLSPGVQTIASGAFAGCGALTQLSIPAGVTGIGDGAFSGCHSLSSVTIPGSVSTLGGAFAGCSGLTSVLIGGGTQTIADGAFAGCSALESVTIPGSVSTIVNGAFASCDALSDIYYAGSETQWLALVGDEPESAIAQATVHFGYSSGSEIGYLTYTASSSAVTITGYTDELPAVLAIPAGIDGKPVTAIGASAFSGCSVLESVTIPGCVTSIGGGAFSGCSALESVTIPAAAASIGGSAFSGCPLLATAGPGAGYDIDFGWTESIPANAFSGCASLTGVSIPASVTSIGSAAFSGCSSLTALVLPDGISAIPASLFSGCGGLAALSIPDGVTSIGQNAFSGCAALAQLFIPASVTSLDANAFSGCGALVSAGPAGGGYDYEFGWTESIPANAFAGCSALESVTIPASVTSIGAKAFSGCSLLTSAGPIGGGYGIEYGWTASIPASAFAGCVSLADVAIPAGVTSIGAKAFSGCTALSHVVIPASATSFGSNVFLSCSLLKTAGPTGGGYNIEYGWSSGIPAYAFYGSRLTGILIPSEIRSVGNYAFYNCSSFSSVYYCGSSSQWNAVSIGSNNAPLRNAQVYYGYVQGSSVPYLLYTEDGGTLTVTGYTEDLPASFTLPRGIDGKAIVGIDSGAFQNCTWLTGIVIQSGVTSIGSEAFSGCSSLASISLPSTLTTLGSAAFSGCNALSSVTIPGSVTSLGNAFAGCTGLTGVTLSSGVQSIGVRAFENCTALSSITVPNSVSSIGAYAFKDCSSLAAFTIPSGVTVIDSGVFSGCSSLAKLIVPASVQTVTYQAFSGCTALKTAGPAGGGYDFEFGWTADIPDHAFSYCAWLTGVTLPSALKTIGNNAFDCCTGLASVNLPSGLTSLGNYAFLGCSSLSNVTVPASVTSFGTRCFYGCPLDTAGPTGGGYNYEFGWTAEIPANAFSDCNLLGSAVIPEGVTSIGVSAFARSGLAYIVIPTTVTSIGSSAFDWASPLTDVFYRGSEQQWSCINISSYYNSRLLSATRHYFCRSSDELPYLSWALKEDGTIAITGFSDSLPAELQLPGAIDRVDVTEIAASAFENAVGLETVSVPASVSAIGDRAFAGCTGLSTVSLPGALTALGSEVFSGCSALTEISIPYTVTSIGDGAFEGCSALAGISFPSSLTSIGDGAFSGCCSLSSVTIPGGVTTVGNAFAGCTGLANVVLSEGVTSIEAGAFAGCSALAGISFPSTLTSIGDGAFSGCNALTEVTVPGGVTTIGTAFAGCTGLTSVVLSEGVTSIEAGAFAGCASLAGISLPSTLTSIGDGAFSGCNALTEVTVPGGVTTIGNAFAGCTGLTNVVLSDGVTAIGAYAFRDCTGLVGITIPDTVTSIGEGAFSGCSALTDITLPSGLTVIADSLFSGCGALTSITIPDGVTSIGAYAFCNCVGLTSLVIPASVTSIGEYAFSGCTGLVSLTFPGQPPVFGDQALAGTTVIIFRAPDVPWPDDVLAQAGGQVTVQIGGAFCGPSVAWSLSDEGTLTLIGAGAMFDYAAPEETPWFSRRSEILKLEIGSGITTLGSYAFAGCGQLKSIAFSDGLISIGGHAFEGCAALKNLRLMPASLRTVGDYAFAQCTALTMAYLPDGLTSIGERAFNGCSALNHVYFPVSVTMGTGAFAGCVAVYNIVLLPGTGVMKDYTAESWELASMPWFSTESLQCYVTVSEGIENIGDYAFFTSNIRRIILPSTLRRIGQYAFAKCSHMLSPELPDGLESIGAYAFYNIVESAVGTELIVPDSVGSIGEYAFAKSAFVSVVLPSGLTQISDGLFYDYQGAGLRVSIPSSVQTIGENAFYHAPITGALLLPEGLSSIGPYAFSQSAVASINLPTTLAALGAHAFDRAVLLSSITIPRSLQEIPTCAFLYCTRLKSVYFAGLDCSVGTYAFDCCSALSDVYYPGSASQWSSRVAIASGNDPLQNAAFHAYNDSFPVTALEITDQNGAAVNGSVCLLDLSQTDSCRFVVTATPDREVLLVTDTNAPSVAEAELHYVDHQNVLTVRGLSSGRAVIGVQSASNSGVRVEFAVKVVRYVSSVEIRDDYLGYVPTGMTVPLTAVVLPENADNRHVAWSVQNGTGKASIDSVGKLTGIEPGTVTVTAATSDGSGVSASRVFTVRDYGISAPEEQTHARLRSGDALQLQAVFDPINIYGTTILWSVSVGDSQFISLSDGGLVTAKTVTEEHTVTVTAAAADGSASTDFHITVYPGSQLVEIVDGSGAIVTGTTVVFDLSRAGLEELRFTAFTRPGDADDEVSWSMTDKNKKKVALFRAGGDGAASILPNGTGNVGTVTLTATAADGSGKKASVKISFARLAQDSDGLVITNAPLQLRGGAALTFKTNMGGIPALTNRTLAWSLDEAGLNYAVLNAAGKLSTFPVDEPVPITVSVRAAANPDAHAEATIILTPAVQSVTLSAPRLTAEVGETVSLAATVLPHTAMDQLVWKSSSAKLATVDANGVVTAKKAGTVTITATAADGSGKKDSVRLTIVNAPVHVGSVTVTARDGVTELAGGRTVQLAAAVLPENATKKDVVWSSSDPTLATVNARGLVTAKKVCAPGAVTVTATAADGSGVAGGIRLQILASPITPVTGVTISGGTALISGRTLTLKAALTPAKPTVSALVWSSSDPAAAEVSAKGVVTAKTVFVPTTVTITAAAADGGGAFCAYPVTVYPRTTRVDVLRGGRPVNNTVQILDTHDAATLPLSAECFPLGQTMDVPVTWKSSNARIAAVDANGVVTAKKAGTVTVTATAADGSGASSSFRLTVRSSVHSLSIRESGVELRGGAKCTLHADFGQITPTNTKVSWSLRPEDASYASVSKKGVLTAKPVTGSHTVVVTVSSAEDPSITASVSVHIYPSVIELRISRNGEDVTSKTLTLLPSEFAAGVRLEGLCYPEEARGEVTWKSSNTKIAAVENGAVTFKKRGRVKITCRAADGSGKSAAVILICP